MASGPLKLERPYEPCLTAEVPKHSFFGIAEIKLHGPGSLYWRHLDRDEATALRDWLDSALASQSSQTEEAA